MENLTADEIISQAKKNGEEMKKYFMDLAEKALLNGIQDTVFITPCTPQELHKLSDKIGIGIISDGIESLKKNPEAWVTTLINKFEVMDYIAIKMFGIRYFYFTPLITLRLSELESK